MRNVLPELLLGPVCICLMICNSFGGRVEEWNVADAGAGSSCWQTGIGSM